MNLRARLIKIFQGILNPRVLDDDDADDRLFQHIHGQKINELSFTSKSILLCIRIEFACFFCRTFEMKKYKHQEQSRKPFNWIKADKS